MTEERRKSLNAIAKRFRICPLTVYLLAGEGVTGEYRPTAKELSRRQQYSYLPKVYELI